MLWGSLVVQEMAGLQKLVLNAFPGWFTNKYKSELSTKIKLLPDRAYEPTLIMLIKNHSVRAI